ncbi:hypothetical protein DTO027B5_6014 [Paecilomyces variotii]|nr:hypothetical protein DTO027B3_5070 [Paecilomyces variotii]KAJ9332207.1 hypothetical protein DTO027B5_6014 [Paecilomyces variotii]
MERYCYPEKYGMKPKSTAMPTIDENTHMEDAPDSNPYSDSDSDCDFELDELDPQTVATLEAEFGPGAAQQDFGLDPEFAAVLDAEFGERPNAKLGQEFDSELHSVRDSESNVEVESEVESEVDSVRDSVRYSEPHIGVHSGVDSERDIEVESEEDSERHSEVDARFNSALRSDPNPKVDHDTEKPPGKRDYPKCERPPLSPPEPLKVSKVRIDDRGLFKRYTGMSLPEPGRVRVSVYGRPKLVPRSVNPKKRSPPPKEPKNRPLTGVAASKYAMPGYRPSPIWKKPDGPTYRTYNTRPYLRGRYVCDEDRDPLDVEADERKRRADHLESLREQDQSVPGGWPDDDRMEITREINLDRVPRQIADELRNMPHYEPCTINDEGANSKDQIALMSGALNTRPRVSEHGITIPLHSVRDSSNDGKKQELVAHNGDYVTFFCDKDWLSCARQVKVAFPGARRVGIVAMEFVQGAVNLGDTFKRRALSLFERRHTAEERDRTKNGRLRKGSRGRQTARDRDRQRRRSWNSSRPTTPEKYNSSTASYSSLPSGYHYSNSALTLPPPETPTAGLLSSLNYQTSNMSQPHFHSSGPSSYLETPESPEIEMSDSSGNELDSSEIEMLDSSDENADIHGYSSSLPHTSPFASTSSAKVHTSSQFEMSDTRMPGRSSSSVPFQHTTTSAPRNSAHAKSSTVLTYGQAVRRAMITRPISAIAKSLTLASVYKLGRAVAHVTGRSRAKPSGITKPVRRGRHTRRTKEDLKKKLERFPNEFVVPWFRPPKPSTPLAQPSVSAQPSTPAQPSKGAPEALFSHKRKADGQIVSTPRLPTTETSETHPVPPTTSPIPQPAQPKSATRPPRKIGPILDVGPLPGLEERRRERQRRIAEGDRKIGPVRDLEGPLPGLAERRLERQRRFAEGYQTIEPDLNGELLPGFTTRRLERQRHIMDGDQNKKLAALLYPELVPLPDDGDSEKGPEDYPLPEDGDDEKGPEDYPLPEDEDEELRPEYIPLPERLVEPEPTAAGPAPWLQSDVPFGKPVSAVRIFNPEAVEREPTREESSYATVWRDVEEPEAQRQPPARIWPEGPAVRPLPAQWKDILATSMAKRDDEPLATTLRGAKLTKMDLMTCYKPMAWLNDEIINGYLELIVAYLRRISGNTGRNEKPKYHAFSTFFFSNLHQKGYAGVAKWATRAKIGGEGLLNVDTVFIPVHNSAHWTLMVVKPSARTIEHFDSLGSLSPAYVALAKGWLRGELGQLYVDEEWNVLPSISPQQDNGSDCGVFLLSTAKAVAVGLEPLSYGAADIPLLRQKIVAELMRGGLEGEFDPAGESGELRL